MRSANCSGVAGPRASAAVEAEPVADHHAPAVPVAPRSPTKRPSRSFSVSWSMSWFPPSCTTASARRCRGSDACCRLPDSTPDRACCRRRWDEVDVSDGPALRVEVLGPLRVVVGGAPVEVPGPKRRAVLALLAFAEGRTVTVDLLVDALWPGDAPESARQALHTHVLRLRAHLGPAAPGCRRAPTATGSIRRDVDVAGAGAARERPARDPRAWRVAGGARALAGAGAGRPHRCRADRRCGGGLPSAAPGGHRRAGRRAVPRPGGRGARSRRGVGGRGPTARTGRAGADPRWRPAGRRPKRCGSGGSSGAGWPRRPASTRRRRWPSWSARWRAARPAPPRRGPIRRPGRRRGCWGAGRGGRRPAPDARRGAPGQRGGAGRRREDPGRGGGGGPVGDRGGAAARPDHRAGRRRARAGGGAEPASGAGRRPGGVPGRARRPPRPARDRQLRAPAGGGPGRGRHGACPPARGCRVLTTSREPLALAAGTSTGWRRSHCPGSGPGVADVPLRRGLPRPGPLGFSGRTSARRPPTWRRLRRSCGGSTACRWPSSSRPGRLSTFSLTDLRDRLDRSLDLLAGGRPSGDTRHRTLRATVEWSYQLLGPDEQRLFRHLSVFVDGVDLDTAEQVARGLGFGRRSRQRAGPPRRHLHDRLYLFNRVHRDRHPVPDARDAAGVRAGPVGRGRRGQRRRRQQQLVRWAVELIAWIEATTACTEREPAADAALRRELPNLRAAWRLARDTVIALDDAAAMVPAADRGDRLPGPDRGPGLGRGAFSSPRIRRSTATSWPVPVLGAAGVGRLPPWRLPPRPTGSRGSGSTGRPTRRRVDCPAPCWPWSRWRAGSSARPSTMVAAVGSGVRVDETCGSPPSARPTAATSTGRGS